MSFLVFFLSLGFLLAGLILVCLPLTRSLPPVFFKGAPYVSTDSGRVEKMVELLGLRAGEKAADLGSGDGRLILALARAGAEAHGYEINPWLVWSSRRKIEKAGLADRAFIHWQTFWKEDFSRFDGLTVYGISYVMGDLEVKLKKELRPGARVVSNYFAFPNWPESKREGNLRLYKKLPFVVTANLS